MTFTRTDHVLHTDCTIQFEIASHFTFRYSLAYRFRGSTYLNHLNCRDILVCVTKGSGLEVLISIPGITRWFFSPQRPEWCPHTALSMGKEAFSIGAKRLGGEAEHTFIYFRYQ
jgi:hypothetical protein